MRLSVESLSKLNEFERIYSSIMCELLLDENPNFASIRWNFLESKPLEKYHLEDLRNTLIDMRDFFSEIISDENFQFHQYDGIFKRIVEITNYMANMVWEEYNSNIE